MGLSLSETTQQSHDIEEIRRHSKNFGTAALGFNYPQLLSCAGGARPQSAVPRCIAKRIVAKLFSPPGPPLTHREIRERYEASHCQDHEAKSDLNIIEESMLYYIGLEVGRRVSREYPPLQPWVALVAEAWTALSLSKRLRPTDGKSQ
jgi:hypothetical protein